MFTKEFDIRWSDLDANRHLANSAFINFMSHTRMAYLIENGFGQKEMAKYNIGPVIFYEHIFYFREVLQGKPIKVSFEVGDFVVVTLRISVIFLMFCPLFFDLDKTLSFE